jgi:3-oxoacyl-[acyl-carrier-protein] synthase II
MVVISGWTVVSAYGLGEAAFTAGLAERRAMTRAVHPAEWAVPEERTSLVPDFDLRAELGRKGTRTMDRATAYAVKAVELLLAGESDLPPYGDRTMEPAVIMGTGAGSLRTTMDFAADSFTGDKPYHVDPSRYPVTVMNYAASQCAIRHRLRGPNITLASGRTTVLLALRHAMRLCRHRRAEAVVCGATEEHSEQRAWLRWQGDRRSPSGEGSAVFLVETAASAARAGRPVRAEPIGLGFGVWSRDTSAQEVLTDLLRTRLAQAGATPADVWAVAVSGAAASGRPAEEEAAAVAAVLGGRPVINVPDLLGDAGAVTGGFQLAGLLALAGTADSNRPPLAALTSIDPDGQVGCALVHLP